MEFIIFIIVIVIIALVVWSTIKLKIKSTDKKHKLEKDRPSKNLIKKIHWSLKVLIGLSLLVVLPLIFPYFFTALYLVTIGGIMSFQSDIAYNKSFETVYEVRDYNDARLDFYNHELENSYEKYVHAKTRKEIFEGDVKVDLALECIEYYLEKNYENDWINVRSNIRNNARNKFIDTDELKKNVKNNERQVGSNFYLYGTNSVNTIINTIANRWGNPLKPNKCDENLTVNQMYSIFLPIYVSKYTENLTTSRLKPDEILKEVHIEYDVWLKEITDSCKECSIYETFEKRSINRRLKPESILFAMVKHRLGSANISDMLKRYKVDVNVVDAEGKTPLFYLINLKSNIHHVKSFIENGADVLHKDNYGKTIFDYFDKNTSIIIVDLLNAEKNKLLSEDFNHTKN